jgi:hypothetical protein
MKPGRRNFLRGLGAGVFGTLVGVRESWAAKPALPRLDGSNTEAFWNAVRAQYPLLSDPAYLNTGGLGPAPLPVLEMVEAVSRRNWLTMTRSLPLMMNSPPPTMIGISPR